MVCPLHALLLAPHEMPALTAQQRRGLLQAAAAACWPALTAPGEWPLPGGADAWETLATLLTPLGATWAAAVLAQMAGAGGEVN